MNRINIGGNLNKVGGGMTLLASSDDSKEVWKMSPFYAFKLLGMMHNTVLARTNPKNVDWRPWTTKWNSKPYASSYWTVEDVPYVTAAATISDDYKEISVMLLNKNTVNDYNVNLDLGSFVPTADYTKYVLNSNALDEGHGDIYDRNLYPDTNAGIEAKTEVELIKTYYKTGAGQSLSVNIPSHSATLLMFTYYSPSRK